MDMSEEESSGKGLEYGAMYVGLSNIISYTIVSTAAMLAFYFAFQGALITYFPQMMSSLKGVSYTFCSMKIEVGKLILSFLCVVSLIFNIWSYHVVMLFGEYYSALLEAGEKIEVQTRSEKFGIYSGMSRAYKTGASRRNIFVTTIIFFGALILVWIGLIGVVWLS